MTTGIRVGTILIREGLLLPQVLRVKSTPYSGGWRRVRALQGPNFAHHIQSAGWNFLFAAGKVRALALGWPGEKSLGRAVRRMLGRLRARNFNCAEITGIASGRFLGVPYVTVFAHPRHIQKGQSLQSTSERRQAQHQTDWASA